MRFEELLDGRVYDLGHPLNRDTPIWPSHPPFFMTLSNRHGDVPDPADCGYGSANEIIVTSGHHSTHIDSLAHISSYGQLYGDVQAATVQMGVGQRRGFVSHGVDKIAPIVRRGILLDVAAVKGKEHLDPAQRVTDEDLIEAATAHEVTVGPGDCVLIRTGWSAFFGDKEVYIGQQGGLPGPDISAAKWLVSQGVFLSGSDTLPYEWRHPDVPGMPVHQELIAKNGIHIVESLNLEQLSEDRVYEFLFIALPLRITGATGSPIRPVAIV
ncbi:cyclase family protein [Alicyclobacillus tolerans]|uniref:cyclase family protein n=1 Tax=Alicyclobacillus tolerans TaxID=90970 RepID=UPI001F0231CD|nr:cyclase family protein [Alicyclobacillus tolerans]MCF8563240.1 cyclase family protein [Alicyclobacillus tolerans]